MRSSSVRVFITESTHCLHRSSVASRFTKAGSTGGKVSANSWLNRASDAICPPLSTINNDNNNLRM